MDAASERFREFVKTVGRGERRAKPLSFEDARTAMGLILDGGVDPEQRGAFLLACRIKGEDPEEMAGFVAAMQERCQTLTDSGQTGMSTARPAISIGHPYDGREDTFIMGAGAAMVAAACGARIVLHSAGRVPPKCAPTVADVLQCMQLPQHLGREDGIERLKRSGYAHVDTRKFLPAWSAQLPIREKIGLRLPFSSAEKLLDLAGDKRVIVGIAHGPYLEKMTGAMRRLGISGAVIQGLEGSCDLSPQHPTRVVRVDGDAVTEVAMDPRALGIDPALAVRGIDCVQSARLTEQALNGAADEMSRGAAEAIALNAAVLLWIAGIASDVAAGLALARERVLNFEF